MQLQAGNPCPNFSGIIQNGNRVSLSDFAGKKLVLYFYPKDDTPGCTAESCDLRDNYKTLQKQGYAVLGVSPDGPKKHIKFIEKYNLPFDLIADEDHSVCEQFGVWVEKSMYGRKYMGVARTTFLVDEKGLITEIIDKVDTANHSSQILG
ncbi:MAG: thioredoxin-dependent thiol peroxidase [Bacteroidetes bacterium]|nr:thioredoxin-dependent thiol peroxidase [Bacteroidota bacterium]